MTLRLLMRSIADIGSQTGLAAISVLAGLLLNDAVLPTCHAQAVSPAASSPAMRPNATMRNRAGWSGGTGWSGETGWNRPQSGLPGGSPTIVSPQLLNGSQPVISPWFDNSMYYGLVNPWWGNFYGPGMPWLNPPVYVRHSDNAVVVVPLLGLDGLWHDGWHDGWPAAVSGVYSTWGRSSASYSYSMIPRLPAFPPSLQLMVENPLPADHGWQLPLETPVAEIIELPKREPADVEVVFSDEFPMMPVENRHSSTADRLQSLRHQVTGDNAFRKEDYAAAMIAYQRAIDAAPERPAPWLRMAITKTADQQFPEAVSNLKTALTLTGDTTGSWIPASDLYGNHPAETLERHSSQLWDWLSENPLSADRLLLTSVFQKFQNADAVAQELLSMLDSDERQQQYALAVLTLADQTAHPTPPSDDPDASSRDDPGIRMKGRSAQLLTPPPPPPPPPMPPMPLPLVPLHSEHPAQ